MSFILYVAVLAVSITSVMIGLDWISSPPRPIPESVQTAQAPAKPAEPKKTDAKKTAAAKETPKATVSGQSAATTGKASSTSSTSVTETEAAKSARAESNATDATAAPAADRADVAAAAIETAGSPPAGAIGGPQSDGPDGTLSITTNEGEASSAAVEAPAPRCDLQACGQRYISFDASDCTYQPFDGPRRLCTVGNPPRQADDGPAGVQTSDASRQPASPSCNYDACAGAYRSFDPGTCSYQPFEGPRRLCTK